MTCSLALDALFPSGLKCTTIAGPSWQCNCLLLPFCVASCNCCWRCHRSLAQGCESAEANSASGLLIEIERERDLRPLALILTSVTAGCELRLFQLSALLGTAAELENVKCSFN